MLGPILPLLGELTLCIGCRPRLYRPASSAAALNVGLSNLVVDTFGAGWLWRNASLRKAACDEMEKEGSAQNPRGQPEPGLALLTAADWSAGPALRHSSAGWVQLETIQFSGA